MMKKRIIQVMVALCLILSLMPMNAKAAGAPSLTVEMVGTKYEDYRISVANRPDNSVINVICYDKDGRFIGLDNTGALAIPTFSSVGRLYKDLPNGTCYLTVCLLPENGYVPYCAARKVTLYPTVEFYDGDNLIKTLTFTAGQKYGELPAPTKEGYEFIGWYTEAEGGTRIQTSDKVSENAPLKLYAHWRKGTYLISFYDGDKLITTKTLGYRDSYGTLPELDPRDGYEFLGWFTEDGTKATEGTEATGEKDIDLYAQWRKLNLTTSFYDGDELIGTKTVTLGEKYGELPVPKERDGFYFLGWYTAAEDGDQITAATKVSTQTDITLYAQWKELKEIPAEAIDFGEMESVNFGYQGESPKKQTAAYEYSAVDGVSYPKSGYKFEYKRHGSDEYEPDGTARYVGTYDVTVTRAADKNYKAFEHTYEGVLVINKGVHYNGSMEFVDIIVADRGYTWFEFDLKETGEYLTISEDAEITYYVSAAQEVWYTSGAGNNVVYLDDYGGNDFFVFVDICNDPNWEDWRSTVRNNNMYPNHSEEYRYNLLEPPVTSWNVLANTSWYSEDAPAFTITTPEQLAGFAYLVNAGNSFEGQTVLLGNDIDLRNCEWVPIGTKTKPFKGTFDGQGKTIKNAYLDENYTYSGLFGYTSGAWVEDLTMEGAYIAANEYGGGIIGGAVDTQLLNCVSYAKVSSSTEGRAGGGIVGAASNTSVVKCINYGRLEGMGNIGGIVGEGTSNTTVDSCRNYGVITCARNATGGIVGRGSAITVANCLNYGQVSTDVSTAVGFGGIIGHVVSGEVYNCVNFGPVTGYNTVGGIVGLNETADCELYNCYNVGSVWGKSRSYIGAVIGRNQKNEGTVKYCYYQAGSARYSSSGENVYGAGTKDSSTDSVENLDIGYFTVSEDWVMNVYGHWYGGDQNAVSGGTLIDVLNAWQGAHVNGGYPLAKWWVADPSRYPVPYTDAW